jgi:hypothetical protein
MWSSIGVNIFGEETAEFCCCLCFKYKNLYLHSSSEVSTYYLRPRPNKNNQVQCMRCQQYGHTKRYCNMPYVCVKCSGNHSTASCTKSNDSPAKCALCGGNHPANYKGCEHYHNLIKTKNNQANSAPININARRFQLQHSTTTYQQKSYADIARMNTNQDEELGPRHSSGG